MNHPAILSGMAGGHGGAREGAGRPRVGDAVLRFKVSGELLEVLDAYAALYEVEDSKGNPRALNRSEAVRHLLDGHARRVVEASRRAEEGT